MTSNPFEARWRAALSEVEEATQAYARLTPLSPRDLGEGEEELAWQRLSRAVHDYAEARAEYVNDRVIDQ